MHQESPIRNRDSFLHQNKSSFQSTLSMIVSVTVVFALMRFTGVCTSSSLGLRSSKASSSVSCPPLPPYTATLFDHMRIPDSGSLLKLPSCGLLLLRHVEVILLEGLKNPSCPGLLPLALSWIMRAMRGRSEGRQADTTAIEGSAADQTKDGAKSSVAGC